MFRIALFIGTNIAIIALISMVFRLFGLEGLLQDNGVNLNLGALLIYSAVIGFAGSLISLFLSKPIAKASMGVRIITSPNNRMEQWLIKTVKDLSDKAGIESPELGVFGSEAPNAFATGWNKNAALVAVSTGLLKQMDRGEIEAVLAHEISHVANGDMVTLGLIQGVVNTFVIFFSRVVGHVIDRAVFRVESGHGPAYWIVSMVSEFIFGILAMTIVMWFSRWREYRADAGGAALAGRQNMINALRALQASSEPEPLPVEVRSMAISAGRVQAFFASHPPLSDRIAALEGRS